MLNLDIIKMSWDDELKETLTNIDYILRSDSGTFSTVKFYNGEWTEMRDQTVKNNKFNNGQFKHWLFDCFRRLDSYCLRLTYENTYFSF